jgi:hypothetical protein
MYDRIGQVALPEKHSLEMIKEAWEAFNGTDPEPCALP